MGTNFYLHTPKEQLHIGKSSVGWAFALRVYPDRGINSFDDWIKLFQDEKNNFTTEYREIITFDEMYDAITQRHGLVDSNKPAPFGYETWELFLNANCAEFCFNGLLRARISDLCVGHGTGTWDYFIGDFS